MNLVKISNIDCLYCKQKGSCATNPELITTENKIIKRPIFCLACNRRWFDFYGENSEEDIILSVQRSTSVNSDK